MYGMYITKVVKWKVDFTTAQPIAQQRLLVPCLQETYTWT